MAMTMHPSAGIWDTILELTKSAQERNIDPLLWAVELNSILNSAGITLPSVELAHIMVSHICWDNNVPITWKFLEKALSLKFVPRMLVLALLSSRIIPSRQLYPGAYRLYLELLVRQDFSSASHMQRSNLEKVMESIDDVLHLSHRFGIQTCEPGALLVLLVFYILWQLLDASLDDEGLLKYTPDKSSRWLSRLQDMEVDNQNSYEEKRTGNHRALKTVNTSLAIDIIGDYLQNKATSKILYLARQNMPLHWGDFIRNLQVLALNSSDIRNSRRMTPETLLKLASDSCKVLPRECKTSLQQDFHVLMVPGSLIPSIGQSHGASRSGLWMPIDLFLEDAMGGLIATETSAVDALTDLVKSLQALNGTTWRDTFLGLWVAALRLVQRGRNHTDGPVPRLDTCLCLLLSVTTLAVANIVEEDANNAGESLGSNPSSQIRDQELHSSCRDELVCSLQLLGEFEGLLTPPSSIISVANQAAAKAIMHHSGINVSSGYLDSISMNDMPINCCGNLWHLVIEACIARNLLDTSAYMWPGYVNACSNQIPRTIAGQVHGWSSLINGSSFTPPMVNALISTPASSLAEVKKIYEIAVGGSDEDKVYAATILCGASLVRGWNVQEHVVLFITRLLSPQVIAEYSGGDSHLIAYAPVLNVLLVGISTIDIVQIFSLHGLIPQLAGALMPICEVFGSCSPKITWTLTTGEEINSHAVFSNAFTLLLKLWRFDHPPIERVVGDVPSVGSQLTPEYLLLVRNSQLASPANAAKNQNRCRRSKMLSSVSAEPIFMDSFPKLKCWYRQHQACIASTLSGLEQGNPVHEIVEGLLNMLFRKINTCSQSASSGNSNSSSASEDATLRLQLPAWDLLEAVPFVLDAALTACDHDKLSPRELITGLKDLADFLPASLASIISYFSAEVTRGVWKQASMNGTDWPSPAANLSSVEQQIKKLLAATGIDVPSLDTASSSSPTLPLPLAALLSLTITYKLDKASERFLDLAGRAVIMLSAGCPWPCMPIVASLWAQKVKRWSDFLVFIASRTVFHHNSDTVVQLLRSCFLYTLGLNPAPKLSCGGVGALLGHGFGSHFSAGISPVAPGIFYLRIYPFIRDVMFMTEEILSLLMKSVGEIASSGLPEESMEKRKKSKYGIRYGQVSHAAALTRVKLAASLGASLVWISGGANLVRALVRQTLPSWFISTHKSEHNVGECGGLASMLRGYALAYFVVLCGAFSWGVDAQSPAPKRRPSTLRSHIKFMAMALDGKISLGCNLATWQAYVSGFVSLVVECAPAWLRDVDVDVLVSLSNGLRQWDEEELALSLLGVGGVHAMGAAAKMVIGNVL